MMDTGDVVLHKPTGERWVVAFVSNGRVCCCGWPESYALVSDCVLVKSASAEERRELLYRMAAMEEPGPRRTYARHRLETVEQVLRKLYIEAP